MNKKISAITSTSEQAPKAANGIERLNTEPSADILAAWERTHEALRAEYGEAVFRSWLKPMQVQAFYQGTLEVSVPTRFMRDWIGSHYHERISVLCREANADIQRVQVVVQVQALRDAGASGRSADGMAVPAAAREGALDIYSELSSPLDPRFTFETFVVGKPNAFAHAATRRVVEAQGMPFNPLYIYGGVGLGKTHLMHAMAHALRDTQGRKVVYLSAEKFMYQFVRALRRQDSMNFKEQFRSVDVLMIDDIQFIAGKDTTQEEFFHTFNALVDQGKLIVISGDRAPMDLEGLDERLRSRLGWGLVADIKPSTFDLRLDVVKSKAALMNVDLPADVVHFLAGKITSNIRELEGALNRLAVHRDMTNAPLSLDTTQEVLSDVLRSYERRITIDEIQRKVAEHYNLRLTDMHSARRSRNVARPRQVAMYLCKKLTTRSLPEIGRKFGGRDHTTVMHAVKKVEELMVEDNMFADDVNGVRRLLKGD
jgi:chromosomal replication initiator protein